MEDEEGILQSYEYNEWESIAKPRLLEKYRKTAQSTFRKGSLVNSQISGAFHESVGGQEK